MNIEIDKQKQNTEKALREKNGLEKTINTMKKTYKIEMKQAKTKAKEMFEQMLSERLETCQQTYKAEFNLIMD